MNILEIKYVIISTKLSAKLSFIFLIACFIKFVFFPFNGFYNKDYKYQRIKGA